MQQENDLTTSKKPIASRLAEWLLIIIVVGYAALLLIAPMVAIVWGALAEGFGGFIGQLTSSDALSAIVLTLETAILATLINTIFGVCIAWVLARDSFWGKRILNGLVDMPFAVSPVIAGFMLILLFGRNGWLTPLANAFGI